jgi:hypothetical protein
VITSPMVRRVFALTEADRLVTVYPTLADARSDLAEDPHPNGNHPAPGRRRRR